MGTYKVKVEYTFQCEWEIKAENKNDANRRVLDGSGCGNPKYESSLSDIVDWEGELKPSKIKIKK